MDELDVWLPELLAENISAVTIHARTRKEMSDVPARWDAIARAVAIRDGLSAGGGSASGGKSKTLIIGNGDVQGIADARAKAEMSGADGIMLGRAIFGNPWLFSNSSAGGGSSSGGQECWNVKEAKLEALAKHLKLFDELLSETANYACMKKHFASYVKGWNGAKELRIKLMDTNSVAEALSILAGV